MNSIQAFVPVSVLTSAPSTSARASCNSLRPSLCAPAPLSLSSRASSFFPTAMQNASSLTSTTAKRSSVLRMVLSDPSGPNVEAPASDSLSTEISTARRNYLYSFIRDGPVFRRAELIMHPDDNTGCVTDSFETCLDDWIEVGSILEDALGSQANDIRVYQYYLPIYFWILRELSRHNDNIAKSADPKPRPFILGFCCPQGGGKTTMTTFMETLLRANGKNVQIASLDDFYLTNKEQCGIAEKHVGNRLMQYRGMPGTHDVPLMTETLDSLRQGKTVSIPQYDKTAFGGRGDRAPQSKWKHISESTDVVLLEGWCLGFEPVDKENIIDPDLHVVNEALVDFDKVYKRLDGLFLIEIAEMEWVFDWRMQAERGTRAAGRPGLTDEQVIDFVGRFMPAYKQYSRQLYDRPTPLIPNHELHIQIDEERRPVHRQ